jgi:hypothetical protein
MNEWIMIEKDDYEKTKSEYVLLLKSSNYFEDINKYIKNLNTLCEIDIPRHNIYINNLKINTLTTLNKRLEYFKNISNEKIYMIKLLCTQTAWGLPFEILSKLEKNNYIGELSKKKKNKLIILKFNIKNNLIKIKTIKILRCFKLNNNGDDETIGLYKCIIYGDLTEDNLIFNWKYYLNNKEKKNVKK